MRLLLIVMMLSSWIFGQGYSSIDSEAMGVGRAFTASSPFNPANLGFRGNILRSKEEKAAKVTTKTTTTLNGETVGEDGNVTEEEPEELSSHFLQLYLSGEYVVSGTLVETASNISDIVDRNGGLENFVAKFETDTADADDIQDGMSLLDNIAQLEDEDDSYALADVSANLGYFYENIGVSLTVYGNAGFTPIVDSDNVAYGDSADLSGNPAEIYDIPAQDRSAELSAQQQDLADQLVADNPGQINQNQAEELVFQADQAGIDTNDPLFENIFRNFVNSTLNNQGSIENNESGILVRSFAITEVGLSYGHALIEDFFSIGINLKAVHIRVYEDEFDIDELEDGEELIEELLDRIDEKNESFERFSFDLGASLRPLPGLTLSAYARNVIPYSVEFESGKNLDIDTQFRAGFAYDVLNMSILTILADVDLNPISYDTVNDYRSQNIGGGLELNPLSKLSPVGLKIRAGVFKNMRESEQDAIFTAGLGVKFWKLTLNVNAQGSFDTEKVQSDDFGDDDVEIPERLGISAGIVFDTKF